MAIGPLMIDVGGLSLTAEDRELLASPWVGGLILFDRNIDTPEQVQALTQAIREVNPDILIAVDQEGGRVQRLRKGFTPLPPMRIFGQLYDHAAQFARNVTETCGWLMAVEVLSVGIDFSFAPVLDLDYAKSDIIGNRAFHTDPAIASELAHCFIHGMMKAGMQATGKHFPGHGFVAEDSHTDLPIDTRDFDAIEAQDMQPFVDLMQHGLQAVMPAHIVYESVDDKPVCYSEKWLKTILRERLKFQGVIFSDDLCMAGATAAGPIETRVRQALAAGCDMALICNHRPSVLQAIEKLNSKPALNPRLQRMRGVCKLPRDVMLENPNWQQAQKLIMDVVKEQG